MPITANTVGRVIYQETRSSLSRKEAKLIEHYLSAQRDFDDELVAEYDQLIEMLDVNVSDYFTVLDRAISPSFLVPALGRSNSRRR